jgi:hypothetical protein
MKKRTKKKIGNFFETIIRFIIKLIFVYPFKLAWLIIKNFYLVIKELFNRKDKITSKEEKTEKIEVKKGQLQAQPEYHPLEEIKSNRGTLEKFEQGLYTKKSTIGLILGARGSGKSAIGMYLLENFKTQSDKNIYALGFKPNSLPKWITVIKDINNLENHSVILIDEGGIEFSSRSSMSSANKLLSELLMIARHKDLSVMMITQNSSNLEINAIRQADYIVLKKGSLLQNEFERKIIKKIYDQIQNDFDDDQGTTYIYADNYRGFVKNGLPTFWSDKVSKGYAQK